MQAIRFEQTGGPEVLHLEDIELPAPRAGEVRVRHAAIGVNFIDTYHRCGLYPVKLPSGLGLEAAGTVEAVGAGVTNPKIGDHVAYCSGPIGAYAEANNVPADRVVKIPAGIPDEVAAAALLKGLTAHYLLKRTYVVQPGQTILVHSAAGGVGLIACQWAKHLGAAVIGTVGSDNKVALASENGCAHVLNLKSDDWSKRVRELTGGNGVPVVYDSIGKDTFMGSLDCLAIRGMMVTFGNSSGAVPAFEPNLLNAKGSLYLTRPKLMDYTRTTKELQDGADDLFAVINSGAVKITIGQRFPLAQARAAHEALHSRATTGATILIP
ncbi:MAG TPA: quinone oxidoreductase [Rhizomicrobium sp.]|nr:quinone oxidoreductase [Rhizomicrobium sp.]